MPRCIYPWYLPRYLGTVEFSTDLSCGERREKTSSEDLCIYRYDKEEG